MNRILKNYFSSCSGSESGSNLDFECGGEEKRGKEVSRNFLVGLFFFPSRDDCSDFFSELLRPCCWIANCGKWFGLDSGERK